MADSKRVQRVEREIREIVSTFLISRLRQRPQGLVTVTRVWVAKDLRLARVYFSVLGGEQKPIEVEELLQDQASDVQRELASGMAMKFTPKIEFFYDEGYEEAQRIQERFRSIEAQRAGMVPATEEESEEES